VAKYLNSEIISTDSRQIYKYMDIWTGKITEGETQWIVHHMIDVINPDTYYSVWDYNLEANKHIDYILNSGKIPVLVGWTGLYIDSLIYNNFTSKAPRDESLRNQLEAERLEFGNDYIYKKLQDLDPKYASELHPNNYMYVMRWIEVMLLTGISKLDFVTEKNLKYDVFFINSFSWDNWETIYDTIRQIYFLNNFDSREELYKNIDKRVALMFENWLVEEFKSLLEKWYKKEYFWLNSIGYRELFDYIDWKTSLEETKALVAKNSRNYAKRQLTWMRRYEK
jgi:tRNA dimethylallyltransferase